MAERYEAIDWLHPGLTRGNLMFEALRDDEEGFRVVVSLSSPPIVLPVKLVIRFDKPLAYRNADEGKRLRALSEVHGTQGIYRVHNASLALWLQEESGYLDAATLGTYAIVTSDDWIEVVSSASPVFDWRV